MSEEFSQFELKQLRSAIGASIARMAELLGLSGDKAVATVRKMENGAEPIPGSVQRVARFMQEGVATGSMSMLLPEFLIGSDLDAEIEVEWIFHTRYPRFLAAVCDSPIDGVVCATTDQVEWLCVAMWIDEPVGDSVALVEQAAARFALYTDESI